MESQMVDREAVKTRFQDILKKVASDQALWSKIKDRSVLRAIFANNTRDLAEAGIKGNELISELSNVAQDALLLINQGMLQKEELVKSVDALRGKLEQVTDDFAEMFKGVFSAIIQANTRSENNAKQIAMLNWINRVLVKESEFNKDNKQLCLLQLAYDCLGVVRRNGIDIGDVNVEEPFCAAWKNLGMDADAKFSVSEFVSGLCEDVEKVGLDRFNQIITIDVAGKVIPPEYILKNVRGAGYSAVCQFAVDMQGSAKYIPLEVEKGALLKHINESADKGSVVYTVEELAMEIIRECLAVEKLFCEEHGLVKVETRKEDVEEIEDKVERTVNTSEFDITDALGSFVAISDHAFLATSPSQEDKKCYLESFALVFAADGGYRESHYLVSMAKLFGVEDSLANIRQLTLAPQRISVPGICDMLSTDVRKYAWCVDAMFIGEESGASNQKVKNVILSMCKVFGFKSNELADFLAEVEALALGNDPSALFAAIKGISQRTSAWRSVVDFKRISLKGVFKELRESLAKKSCEASILGFEVTKSSLDMVSSSCSFTMGDENIVQRAAINLIRTSHIAKFKELKTKVESFESSVNPIISEANSILGLFKTPKIYVSGDLSLINADEASGIGNEQWGENMNTAFAKLSNYASEISDVLSGLAAQLALYEEGRYSESAEENAKKVYADREARKSAEKEAMRTAEILMGGVRRVIKMEFEKIPGVPFDFSVARSCAAIGDHWILLVDKECWRSDDGRVWQKADVPIKIEYGTKVKAVNGVVLIWNERRKEFAFSTDGLSWEMSEFPESSGICDIQFFKGRWMLQICKHSKFKFMKERFLLRDTEETDYCSATELYFSPSLSGEWARNVVQNFPEGYYIPEGGMLAVNDELLAVRIIDSSYADKKHIRNCVPMLYYTSGSVWKDASIDGGLKEALIRCSAKFMKVGNNVLFSLNGQGVWFSGDNRNWFKVGDFGLYDFYNVGELICAMGHGEYGPTVYVTADGKTFAPMAIDYQPSVVAFRSDTAVFIVSDPNKGGLFLARIVME